MAGWKRNHLSVILLARNLHSVRGFSSQPRLMKPEGVSETWQWETSPCQKCRVREVPWPWTSGWCVMRDGFTFLSASVFFHWKEPLHKNELSEIQTLTIWFARRPFSRCLALQMNPSVVWGWEFGGYWLSTQTAKVTSVTCSTGVADFSVVELACLSRQKHWFVHMFWPQCCQIWSRHLQGSLIPMSWFSREN